MQRNDGKKLKQRKKTRPKIPLDKVSNRLYIVHMTKTKFSASDKKIPRSLIMDLQGKPYILKSGLEWKANNLFGGAGYSLEMTIVPSLSDLESGTKYVFKAKLTVLENDATYTNYGEASVNNTKSNMKGQLIHLAATRAECRVLRMATACGYASYEEVKTTGEKKEDIAIENGDDPASKGQIATIEAMNKKFKAPKDFTKQQASEVINNLSTKK